MHCQAGKQRLRAGIESKLLQASARARAAPPAGASACAWGQARQSAKLRLTMGELKYHSRLGQPRYGSGPAVQGLGAGGSGGG